MHNHNTLIRLAALVMPFLFLAMPSIAQSPPLTDVLEALPVAPSSVSFEANVGQWDPEALYRVHGSLDAFITRNGLVVTQCVGQGREAFHNETDLTCAAYRLRFVGASASSKVIPAGPLSQASHHIKGNDTTKWIRNAPHYSSVLVKGLYPGIDILYYGTDGQLKYDLIVAPLADAGKIRLAFDGADDVHIDGAGGLAVTVGNQVFSHAAPTTYQPGSPAKLIQSEYTTTSNAFHFKLGKYNHLKPLIIDPLVYGTYLGTASSDWGKAIAIGDAGNAFVGIETAAANVPGEALRLGPFTGEVDVAIARLDPLGALVATTVIGGTADDYVNDIHVDDNGEVYIAGGTMSLDFPLLPGVVVSTPASEVDTLDPTAWLPVRWGVDGYTMKLDVTGSVPLRSAIVNIPAPNYNDEVMSIDVGWDGGSAVAVAGWGDYREGLCSVAVFDPSGLVELERAYWNNGNEGDCPDVWPLPGSVAFGQTGQVYYAGGAGFRLDFTQPSFWRCTGETSIMPIPEEYACGAGVQLTDSCNTSVCFSRVPADLYLYDYEWDERHVIDVDSAGIVFLTNRFETHSFREPGPLEETRWGEAIAVGEAYGGVALALGKSGALNLVGAYGAGAATFGAIQVVSGGSSDMGFAQQVPSTQLVHDNEYPELLSRYRTSYVTLLGGRGAETAADVAVDYLGNVYVVGTTSIAGPNPYGYPTSAEGFPTSLLAAQPTFAGGLRDAVVAKFVPFEFNLTLTSTSHPDAESWSGSPWFNGTATTNQPDQVVGYSFGVGFVSCDDYWGCSISCTPSQAATGDLLQANLAVPSAYGEHVFCVRPKGPAGNYGPTFTYRFRTDLALDTDGDGMPDSWEQMHGTQMQVPDGDADPDTDQLANLDEYGIGTHPRDSDSDGDNLPDGWEVLAGLDPLSAIIEGTDSDDDDLDDLAEFRFRLVPLCIPEAMNCLDHEGDAQTGSGGDAWRDGPEVAYWNDATNDAIGLTAVDHLLEDPESQHDVDADLIRDLDDVDSDNDALTDGFEALTLGSYPEFKDSDCDATATECTTVMQSGNYWDPARVGNPGKGDGLPDGQEYATWQALNADAHLTNYDGDGITDNLLDPDADGDALLDGEEVLVWHTKPHHVDSDVDGLLDGEEVRIYRTDPAAWDTDGDGMPDGWEVDGNLNPLVDDADLDSDADALTNAAEYGYNRIESWNESLQGPWLGGTNPSDADTEGDALLDGEEVLTLATDPFHWDTDLDGAADWFEVTYGFDALNASDAVLDADFDSFDLGSDGSIQQAWPNLNEYTYGRTEWDEVAMGPWRLGTDPLNPDTDGDEASDGMEAYYATDARVPANLESDDDGDGLTWSEEANLGTNPSDADTDGDGLCDGGRAANCLRPGLLGGNWPGEDDYGSIAWELDSDLDGRSDLQEALKWDPTATGSAQDVDGDLLNGVIDNDSDDDGLNDGDEFTRTTDMALADTDQDRLRDGDEVNVYATNPKSADSDGDALRDGDEVDVHHTRPTVTDTDMDGLSDGAEVNTHGTDPLLVDSDQDTLPDQWEVTKGTQARIADADQDPDADELSNARECSLLSNPMAADSDGDGLPDGYEDRFLLGVTAWTRTSDPDADAYTNIDEYNAQTNPQVNDTDGDGRMDGWEANPAKTDPLDADTDNDGLGDGAEYDAWTAGGYPWSIDSDGDTLPGLLDVDSDNDGLNDRDELVDSRTKPHVKDSDADGLSDFDEVFAYGGQYDPNDADTDDDGQSDGVEVALADTNGDFDRDGLKNGAEGTYGTDPSKPDTDCDGVQDGPEYTYWGYEAPLLVADWDGDSIKDGLEIGVVGTPSQTLYKTSPGRIDTDNDGLGDDVEARNTAKVTCGEPQTQAASSSNSANPNLGQPLTASLTAVPGGFYVGQDEHGWYVQGGYGVRLYPTQLLQATPTPMQIVEALGMQPSASQQSSASGPAAGSNGKLTHPTNWDTDGDHIGDGAELNSLGSNPNVCDTDGDGLGDGLESGVAGRTLDQSNACTHLDRDPMTRTNPLASDSDGDGRLDGTEDANRNGLGDQTVLLAEGSFYCGLPGSESDAADADTDDDGIRDGDELLGSVTGATTQPFCFDSDKDGLSDGLEQGVRDPVPSSTSGLATMQGTDTGRKVLAGTWDVWQAFAGTTGPAGPATTDVGDPDSDDDGIPDGLEDINHNGIFGDMASVLGAVELDPADSDSDDDKVLDGRELLVYSPTTGKSLQQDFVDLANSPGFSFGQMLFDADNPWETDPRSTNTDQLSEVNSNSGETVPDGEDLNPRADAFFAFRLDNFRMLTPPDTGDDQWWIDLYLDQVSVQLPFSNAQYAMHVPTDDAVHFKVKDAVELPTDLMDSIRNHVDTSPSMIGTGWDVQAIGDSLKFNLPDSSTSLDLNDRSIKMTLKAMDGDWHYWGAGNPSDRIDLDTLPSETALVHEIKLTEGGNTLNTATTTGLDDPYLAWQATTQPHRGVNEKGAQNEEDGLINVLAGDSVPLHFLQGLDNIMKGGNSGLPGGSCPGVAACIGAA